MHDFVWIRNNEQNNTYHYHVRWYNNFNIIGGNPCHKVFSTKKQAYNFAKEKRGTSPSYFPVPIIIRSIVPKTYFKQDTEIEPIRRRKNVN